MFHFRSHVLHALLQQGHELCIAAPRDLTEIPKQWNNLQIIELDLQRGFATPQKEITTLRQLKKVVSSFAPDLIFSYGLKQALYIGFVNLFFSKLPPRLNIITGLGSSLIDPRYRLLVKSLFIGLDLGEKLTNRRTVTWGFLNHSDQLFFNSLLNLHPQQIFSLPGEGIDLGKYSYCPMPKSEVPHFLMIGRLLKHKGIGEFIAASKELPNCKFTLIAPPDLENPSQEICRFKYQLQNSSIHYLEYTPDVTPYLQKASVVVLPSYGEGIPRVLLEAMAIGRPILTTNTHGCKELVTNNGLSCKKASTVDLVNKMKQFAAMSHEQLAILGKNGRETVEKKWSTQQVIDSYLELLNKITNTAVGEMA